MDELSAGQSSGKTLDCYELMQRFALKTIVISGRPDPDAAGCQVYWQLLSTRPLK